MRDIFALLGRSRTHGPRPPLPRRVPLASPAQRPLAAAARAVKPPPPEPMTAAADFDARSGGSQRTPQRPQQQHGQWKPRQQQRQRQRQCSSKSSSISVIIISSGSSDGSSSYWQRSCVALPEAWIHSMMALTVADHPTWLLGLPQTGLIRPVCGRLKTPTAGDAMCAFTLEPHAHASPRTHRVHILTAALVSRSCAATSGGGTGGRSRRRCRSLRHRRSPPAAAVSCSAAVSRVACASRVAQTFCYTRVCLLCVCGSGVFSPLHPLRSLPQSILFS